MTSGHVRGALGLVILLLAACGGGAGSGDAGVSTDARPSDTGARSDGGVLDGGPEDAGGGVDATAFDAGPVTPHFEIGTGTEAFEPLGPGSTMELVHGPQGGYHVAISFRIWGIDPEGLLIQAHGYDAVTGEEITIPAERVLTARRVSVEGDHLLRLGDRLIFTTTDPTTIYPADAGMGTNLRLTAVLTPAIGDPVSNEITSTVIDTTL